MKFVLLACLCLATGDALASSTPDVAAILAKADHFRGVARTEAVEFQLRVHSTQADGTAAERLYHVNAKGADVLGVVVEPLRFAGDRILATEQGVMQRPKQAAMPTVVRAPDRRNGFAALGEVVALRFSKNFSGKILRTAGEGAQTDYLIELVPTLPEPTFKMIHLWVNKETGRGERAEFFLDGGKLLLKASYVYDLTLVLPKGDSPFVSAIHIENVADNSVADVAYTEARTTKVLPDIKAFFQPRVGSPAP